MERAAKAALFALAEWESPTGPGFSHHVQPVARTERSGLRGRTETPQSASLRAGYLSLAFNTPEIATVSRGEA